MIVLFPNLWSKLEDKTDALEKRKKEKKLDTVALSFSLTQIF